MAEDGSGSVRNNPLPELAWKNLKEIELASAEAAVELASAAPEFINDLANLTIISPPMLDSLRLHPDWLSWLRKDVEIAAPSIFSPQEYEKRWQSLSAITGPSPDPMDRLRCFKRREYLLISFLDISGLISFNQTINQLSHLADWVIAKALAISWQSLSEVDEARLAMQTAPAGFSIFALGKLGGGEINYSSDVDLLFCRGDSDSSEEQRFYTRLGERLIQALARSGPDGFLYRVDMRLRPHGALGPLVPTISSLINYYESWGEAWERQALIKLRYLAGDDSLGKRFHDFAARYTFSRQMDDSSLEEIKRVKHRSEREYATAKGKLNLKHGSGGIRDIEFYVQYLQLIGGCKNLTLRTGATLDAIAALANARLLLEGEESLLTLAYQFFRIVEHRLQLHALTPAAILPEDVRDITPLCRELGFDDGGNLGARRFLHALNSYRSRVRVILERIYLTPGYLRLQEEQEAFAQLITERTPRDRIQGILSRYGFQDIEKAWQNIRLIALGPEGKILPPGERRIFLDFAFPLLDVIGHSYDPDRALHHLESFAAASGNRISFLRTLSSRRPHLLRLSNLLALSGLGRQILERHPEYFDSLARGIHLHEGRTWEEMVQEIRARAGASPRGESKDLLLRKFRQREMVRVAYRDIAGLASALEISRELSDLARACIETALDMTQATRGPFDLDTGQALSTIALGKLGSSQLHYSSDLDLMFLYENASENSSHQQRAEEQKAQDLRIEKILELLAGVSAEGVVYPVDLRLRPEGASGLLAKTWRSFMDYAEEFMQPWERMAFVRSRLLSPLAAVRRWDKLVEEIVYRFTWQSDALESIRHLKKRIETEKNKEDKFILDFKYGKGGIADLEFLVQFLQVQYGKNCEEVRTPGIAQAIPALHVAGAFSAGERDDLLAAHHFQRAVENRYQLMEEWNLREISRESPKLIRLARSLGFTGESPSGIRKALLAAWDENAKLVRGMVMRYFYQ